MKFFLTLLTAFFFAVPAAFAQSSDSVFAGYEDYAAFVDGKIMTRDFIPLIQRLGGRDEYTPEQLANNQRQLENLLPVNFRNVAVFREEDLGGGIRQEGRMYWTGSSYAFYYALLHDRDDALVVISFLLNTSSAPILDRF